MSDLPPPVHDDKAPTPIVPAAPTAAALAKNFLLEN
jgi:hypothetical protein